MTVKQEPEKIISMLQLVQKSLESIISEYLEDYADYGWDSFTEDLSNVSAQLYKDEIMLKNATVIKEG